MKRLTMIRHAKSSWADPGQADIDRPLNRRGKHDAPIMGRILSEKGIVPDIIVCSPAKRARMTATRIAAALEYPRKAIRENRQIYDADLVELAYVVRALDNAFGHVCLIGHNPSFEDFGRSLAETPVVRMPTCAVLHLEKEIDEWQHACDGVWRVVEFLYPKMFTDRDA